MFRTGFAVDVFVFLVGAFGATLLSSFINTSWWAYLIIATVVTGLYAFVRWSLLTPQRIALLAHTTLSDTLADAAASYGVADLYNMQKSEDQNRRNSDTVVTINKAQTMSLAANSGASYLSVGLQRHWPAVRLRLSERVPFKVILLDPFCEERSLRNTVNAAGERDDSKLPMGDIIRASNEFPHLEVRFADKGMTCSVFITQEEAYFDPYHLAEDGGRISNRFMCLKMSKTGVPQGISNYEMMRRHFDTLWIASTPLVNWLDQNEEKMASLPELRVQKRFPV
ncbi:hypothetical protein RWK44_19000 [Rhizobium sp. 25PS6]|uniref:hypothetical protein n=1 Tax=Rhizobium sp. 25PS6 TaxID=3075622 RepID=UPI0028FD67B7|nr:hypothetical protein [Rhizobium sp. 25PS6]MDU0362490.1 hypothetical protein [Rhizobium sp. 25PS6]